MAPDSPVPQPEQVAAFFQKHRTGLVTLVFTDLVDSTALLQQLGDQAGATFLRRRRQLLREILHTLPEAEEIETAGDSFLLVFAKPSDAVRFALQSQARLRTFSLESGLKVQERMGIHLGEVVISEHETEVKAKDLYGIQLAACARVMSLGVGGQVLLTRGAFDSARQVLKGEDIPGVAALQWVSHGPYLLKGIEEPVEVCEVGEARQGPLLAPKTSEKALRQVRTDEEPVLGWRPAVGQEVPNTRWVLEKKLGEGGFGEVWLGRQQQTKERRVFKFCFQAERVRFLRRELTLFRVLKERAGDHPNIVRLHDVYLDQPPFYVEMDYVEGKDLRSWCEEHGGIEGIPLETRVEIVAQAADGLQAAHEAGIIHRDIKPANILVGGKGIETTEVRVKLTDFGIGQVVSEEYLKGITKAGLTQTIMSDSSSSHTGTQLYMAPELLAGKPASPRSDIYSLGVVLYQLLVGDFTRPVTTDWANEISDPLLRDDLKHCFAGNPQDRFAAAGQLANNLRALPERQGALERQEAEKAALERAAYRRGVLRTAAVAALIIAGVVALGMYAFNESRHARVEAIRANLNARQEEHQREVAEGNVYASDMILAFDSLESRNLGYARKLLARHFPKPGQKDLRGWEWRYLWQQCQGDQAFTLGRHAKGVTVAAFVSDKTVASASNDNTVKLWDVESRRLTASLPHSAGVHGLAVSPDRKLLVTGCDDGTVTGWNLESRQPIWHLTNAPDVNALVFSTNGTLLACAGSRRAVLWDAATRQELASYSGRFGNEGFKAGLAISPDNRLLAFGTDHTIEVWDWAHSSRRNFGEHRDFTIALAFSPDGQFLVSGGADYDRTTRIWQVATGREIARLTNFLHWVGWIAFSPDRTILATASGDHLVKLWSTTNWAEIATLRGHEFEVWSVEFSPDGTKLVTASKDDTVKIWDAALRPKHNPAIAAPEGVLRRAFSPDGQTVLQLYTNGTVTLSETIGLLEVRRFSTIHITNVVDLAGSSDRKFVALAAQDGSVTLIDMIVGRQVFNLPGVDPVGFSPDGTSLALRRGDGVIELWDTATNRPPRRLILRPHRNTSLAFSPDSRKAAIGYYDATVDLWDLSTGTRTTLPTGHEERLMCVAFSHNGKKLATSSVDFHLVKLWDIESRKEIAELGGQLAVFASLAFAPDGRLLAAGGADGAVTLWDVANAQPREVGRLKGHPNTVWFLSFSPDGNTLVSEASDGLRVWRAPSLKEIDAEEKSQATK